VLSATIVHCLNHIFICSSCTP